MFYIFDPQTLVINYMVSNLQIVSQHTVFSIMNWKKSNSINHDKKVYYINTHPYSCSHKVNITEGASVQFPIWIFNFWSHGQLRAALKKNRAYYEQFLRTVFFMFSREKKVKKKHCSDRLY